MTDRPVRRALLSVWDKTGVEGLARALHERGVELLSTGGTARSLREAGLPVRDVAEVTGFPEILDGRVKTLHPAIHGGLLARRDSPEHMAAVARHGIEGIDLLVVNLYPFEATAAEGKGFVETVEMIDVGGPALLRAAAKNHDGVAVLVDPADYAAVLDGIDAGAVPADLRRRLAAKAFARTASYDAAIAAWFEARDDGHATRLLLSGELKAPLRYGENPHQKAAFYRMNETRPGVGSAVQLQGKELSYNNLNDTDAAFELVAEFARPAAVIVKHANPCGVALGGTLAEAYSKALKADPVSAFGGVVALNRPLDGATARAIAAVFTEVVIAPGADGEARAVLASKANLRLLVTDGLPDPANGGWLARSVGGGLLLQERDVRRVTAADLKTVTRRAPTEAELADLLFAFAVVKHVKSNAIVYAKGGMTVGVGAGQMSRVDAVRIAASSAAELARAAGEAEPRTRGAVVASDAFFPFVDGLEAAARAGATAVVQPGGSRRDAEVIAAADAAGMAMVFTGVRHFRH